jgi:hypothetical protein
LARWHARRRGTPAIPPGDIAAGAEWAGSRATQAGRLSARAADRMQAAAVALARRPDVPALLARLDPMERTITAWGPAVFLVGLVVIIIVVAL